MDLLALKVTRGTKVMMVFQALKVYRGHQENKVQKVTGESKASLALTG